MDVQLYHVGILVHDLEAAQRTFGELLNVSFGPITVVDIAESDIRVANSPSHEPLRLVISTGGPMYLELIEAQEDGLWGRQLGEGVHHIGFATDDLSCHILRATEHAGVDAIIRRDGRDAATYLSQYMSHGVRVEFVDRSRSLLRKDRY